MEIEPDIENMMLDEYCEYEAKKERGLWDNDRFKNSPTRFFAKSPNTPNTYVDKKDSNFDEILDDLFILGAENLSRIGQEKVQNGCDIDTSRDKNHKSGNHLNFPIYFATNEFYSICEQDVDLGKEEAQQDIYAAGSKNHPSMLNKDNYIPWSSCIIRYARSRPNGKMIIGSIENGPYVRRMIASPGEPALPIDADDQAIQTIILGLPEDVYAVVDSCETAKEIWERVRQMMKGTNISKKTLHRISSFSTTFNLQPEWKRHVTIVRQTKNLHESDFTQIYDFLKMNQEEFGQFAGQVAQNQQGFNAWQNGRIQARAEGTGIGNQARCYNYRGLGHIARNYTARPRIRDDAYLQTQLLIAQKEEAWIQLQAEEFDFMAAAGDLDEIEEVNANCILMANLQQASTFGTQHDKDPVYDTDDSTEVHLNDNCYDNEIFNMFTQEEQYTDLLEPIPEPQPVPQNDNHVTSVAPSMVQSGGIVETSSAPNEEIRAHQETVYRNLVDQVTQVDMVNRNMRATNAELKSELARYKIQEQRVEISQEKYDKLEKCYQKSVYQEQCFTRKINALHLSSAKKITTLNDEISNLNKQLSKEKSSISSLMEEKKRMKHDFKIQEDKFLDKEVDLEARIKDL
nr:hypothetical protein [Tanacetum cinerariifolium]